MMGIGRARHIILLLLVFLACGSDLYAAKKSKWDRKGSFLEKRGDVFMDGFDWHSAIKLYTKSVKKNPSRRSAIEKLATCYRMVNDQVAAELWYGSLAEMDSAKPEWYYYYAQALMANESYDEAKNYFTKYALDAQRMEEPMFKLKVNEIDNLLDENERILDFYNVSNINTKHDEFGPAFYKDEGLAFTSDRGSDFFQIETDNWSQGNFFDVFYAPFDQDKKLTTDVVPLPGKQPNRRYHDGPVFFNDAGLVMFLTRSDYFTRKSRKGKNKTVNLRLFSVGYNQAQKKWDHISSPFPFNSAEYSVGHPTLSSDGNTIFFSSDMQGDDIESYGGADIYMSLRKGVTWGEPINLGPVINSFGDELYPFYAADQSLYFASNGHPGLGGLDVFVTHYEDGAWTKPQNMGAPINTHFDDFSFIINKTNSYGYVASNRDGGAGGDDIYRFDFKGVTLKGLVYDQETGLPLPDALVWIEEMDQQISLDGKAEFTLDVEQNSTLSMQAFLEEYNVGYIEVEIEDSDIYVKIPLSKERGIELEVTVFETRPNSDFEKLLEGASVTITNLNTDISTTAKTEGGGKVLFYLEENTDYLITGKKEYPDPNMAFLTVTSTISTRKKQAPAYLYETLKLQLVEKGVAIKIENIYYDLNKSNIRADARVELDKLVKIMLDNPTMEIELSSHTDCRASWNYNMQLSADRAQSAVGYLISKGVKGARMLAVGYGESRPVNDCLCEDGQGKGLTPACDDGMHQENRRTEFKILRF